MVLGKLLTSVVVPLIATVVSVTLGLSSLNFNLSAVTYIVAPLDNY
jgi:hypothetical protein